LRVPGVVPAAAGGPGGFAGELGEERVDVVAAHRLREAALALAFAGVDELRNQGLDAVGPLEFQRDRDRPGAGDEVLDAEQEARFADAA
jgi:hypothetical protein